MNVVYCHNMMVVLYHLSVNTSIFFYYVAYGHSGPMFCMLYATLWLLGFSFWWWLCVWRGRGEVLEEGSMSFFGNCLLEVHVRKNLWLHLPHPFQGESRERATGASAPPSPPLLSSVGAATVQHSAGSSTRAPHVRKVYRGGSIIRASAPLQTS